MRPRPLAQTYPNRPIRLIVGFPPGGAVDIIAQALRAGLSTRLGQPVVVENKPGTGGNLASDIVAKAAPDGYTLLHGTENVFISNPHVYGARMPFDPFKDLVPVTSLVSNQIVLTVNPSSPANNLREFVELARATKPPLFYASIGNGSKHHLAMEMLKQHVGIDLIARAVSRRRAGGDRAAGRRGRRRCSAAARWCRPIKSGKLRGLASTGTVRNPATPELPTIAEVYPGYEALSWHGVFVPAGTPQPIIDRLRKELKEVRRSPSSRSGWPTPAPASLTWCRPRNSPRASRRDYEKYGKLIRCDRREGGIARATVPSSRRSRR